MRLSVHASFRGAGFCAQQLQGDWLLAGHSCLMVVADLCYTLPRCHDKRTSIPSPQVCLPGKVRMPIVHHGFLISCQSHITKSISDGRCAGMQSCSRPCARCSFLWLLCPQPKLAWSCSTTMKRRSHPLAWCGNTCAAGSLSCRGAWETLLVSTLAYWLTAHQVRR